MKNMRWWMWSAAAVGLLMVVLAVGNLIEDDGGPLFGKLLFAAVLVGGAAAVAAGIPMQRTEPERGSRLIGFGVLPGASGLAFFWFPPAVAVGLLALVTSVTAFRMAGKMAQASRAALYVAPLAAIGLVAVAVGVS